MRPVQINHWKAFVAVALLASGCYMKVKIDSGTDSPNGDLRLAVVTYSGRGEGYDERKEKEIYVSIYRRGSEPREYLYSKQFNLVAGELDWDIAWQSPDQVKVDFFEFPPGFSRWSDAAVYRKAPTIRLMTMTLSRSAGEKPFHEVTTAAR